MQRLKVNSTDPKFPSPIDGSGWPWFRSENPSTANPPAVLFPKISIITPSFNQGHFIEETIRSVLLQDYPNLEYIIIDGGSTDNTLETIKKYEPWITYWESNPDRGQAHAINKGIQKASGEWVAWLNTDDLYLENTLWTIATIISNSSEPLSWIVGTTVLTDARLNEISLFKPQLYTASGRNPKYQPQGWIDFVCTKQSGIALPQPSSFWLRNAVVQAECLNESLQYAMDHELYGRLAYQGFRPTFVDKPLAYFRTHQDQKTSYFPIAFWKEELNVVYNWTGKANSSEKTTLKKYGDWLKKQIKIYPYKSFFQQFLSRLKNIIASKNQRLYAFLKRFHTQYFTDKQ